MQFADTKLRSYSVLLITKTVRDCNVNMHSSGFTAYTAMQFNTMAERSVKRRLVTLTRCTCILITKTPVAEVKFTITHSRGDSAGHP